MRFGKVELLVQHSLKKAQNNMFLIGNVLFSCMNDFAFDKFCFKILEELAWNGRKHLRELAESLKMPASTAFKTLKKLEGRGMVNAEKQKNRKVFSINYESILANNVLRLAITQKIMQSKSLEMLKSLKPAGILLFGSAASGKITPESDLDIAAIFKNKPNVFKISEIKRELEKELKKETQLLTFNDEKLESLKKENQELYNQLHYKSIVLSGENIE